MAIATDQASASDVTSYARKANLFIVGAPKCGTTAWVEYLCTHPDIYFADSKEYCFFALDLPKFRVVHSEDEYAELFARSGNAKILAEASAMYLFSQAAANAMQDYNPQAKILILLREQEEYLPSLHNQFLWEFSEQIEDFETAWKLSEHRSADTIPSTCLEPRTLNYAAMGRFHEQVARYLAAFPVDQVMVLRFREWVADPRNYYLRVLDFLGLEDDGRLQFPRINQGVTYRSRRLVHFLYFPPQFARKLARLIKRIPGLRGRALATSAQRMVSLLSAPGYKKEISEDLCKEIMRYYAKENELLDVQLSHEVVRKDPSISQEFAVTEQPSGGSASFD